MLRAQRSNYSDKRRTLQPLGKVHDLEPGAFVELGKIDNELMSAETLVVGVLDAVVVLQPGSAVVGSEQGDLARIGQTIAAEHCAMFRLKRFERRFG